VTPFVIMALALTVSSSSSLSVRWFFYANQQNIKKKLSHYMV
jgi:hypothetical protein